MTIVCQSFDRVRSTVWLPSARIRINPGPEGPLRAHPAVRPATATGREGIWRKEEEGLLPQVSGFQEPDGSLLGGVISHPHQDHYALARNICSEILVYVEKVAQGSWAGAFWGGEARILRLLPGVVCWR